MTTALPTMRDRRRRRALQRGPQRREAFRIRFPLPVHVNAPSEMVCELRDVSFVGLGVVGELPFAPGSAVSFWLEVPVYGAIAESTYIPLRAEIVRVGRGHTGLRFVDLGRDQARALAELITSRQRMILAARRAGPDARSFRG